MKQELGLGGLPNSLEVKRAFDGAEAWLESWLQLVRSKETKTETKTKKEGEVEEEESFRPRPRASTKVDRSCSSCS